MHTIVHPAYLSTYNITYSRESFNEVLCMWERPRVLSLGREVMDDTPLIR